MDKKYFFHILLHSIFIKNKNSLIIHEVHKTYFLQQTLQNCSSLHASIKGKKLHSYRNKLAVIKLHLKISIPCFE